MALESRALCGHCRGGWFLSAYPPRRFVRKFTLASDLGRPGRRPKAFDISDRRDQYAV